MKPYLVSLSLILVLISATLAIAGPQKSLKRGFVKNDSGQKCWYTQDFIDNTKYFFERHTQNIGIIEFEDENCMKSSEFGLEINKANINTIISRWYSHDDAAFLTNVHEMFPTSRLQIKGQCIQSQTYENIGIAIYYNVNNESIDQVVHGGTIFGCQK